MILLVTYVPRRHGDTEAFDWRVWERAPRNKPSSISYGLFSWGSFYTRRFRGRPAKQAGQSNAS